MVMWCVAQIVQRRVDLMAAEGIIFKTNMTVGENLSAVDLRDNNDALLLCIGSTWPRSLPIPGTLHTTITQIIVNIYLAWLRSV